MQFSDGVQLHEQLHNTKGCTWMKMGEAHREDGLEENVRHHDSLVYER